MKQWLVGENVEKNKKREEMNKEGRGNKEIKNNGETFRKIIFDSLIKDLNNTYIKWVEEKLFRQDIFIQINIYVY